MKRALIICFAVFLLMQFIRPQKVEYSEDETYEIVLPPDIKEIFVRACYDCHSNKINYPWYSNVAPFSWVVANHHSSMPLPAYTWAHIEAELSKEEREKIRDWTGVRK